METDSLRTEQGKRSKADRKLKRLEKRVGRLFKDISNGALLQVERKISKRPKLIYAKDDRGRRALHIAAASGCFQIVLLLLRRGADIHCVDDSGNSALHAAAKHRRWEIAEVLLDKGARRDLSNSDGKTPSSFGLDDALAEIRMEDERIFQRQECIVEERSRFQREQASGDGAKEAHEREWREKLMEEHCFEYIEGSGHGAEQRVEAMGAIFLEGWFTADEKLSDDDWWAELGRQMHSRYRAFSHNNARTTSPPIQPDDGARDHSAGPGQQGGPSARFAGAGEEEKMAWERRQKAGQPQGPAGGSAAAMSWRAGYEARAAAHALAWERFIGSKSGAITHDLVPWPVVPPGGDLATEAMMLPLLDSNDADLRRRAVREALRRWHPDKFEQKFGERLVEEERACILERVKIISQALTALVS